MTKKNGSGVFGRNRKGDRMTTGECPHCAGLGFWRADVPVGHPDFGQLKQCRSDWHKAERLERLEALCGLSAHERKHRLDGIMSLNDVSAELAARVADFVKNRRGWLYIWGGPGNGKTLALMAAVNAFVDGGDAALYTTWADVVGLLKETFDRKPRGHRGNGNDVAWAEWDTFERRLRYIQRVPLLAIDEFDVGKTTDSKWQREIRNRLIDHRYRSAESGETCTLFAGNEDPRRLPRFIWDRVQDGRFDVFENTGASVRPVMAW
jgi:DNA replication protein DnaC